MSEQDSLKNNHNLDSVGSLSRGREISDQILSLSGSEALNKILDHFNPRQLVQRMSKVDLFWLIKKIGQDDSLPLLKLASNDQWQYIMDMELWHRDSIGMKEIFQWLERFHNADPVRLAEWLYSEDGNLLAHLFFNYVLEVKIKEDQDDIIPDGFFTYDNLHFISIHSEENKEVIEQMLRQLSSLDYNRFQALLLGLTGIIPAEVQEEMYRLKSVRLAEDGYLPFEEAISIYSYQRPELLKQGSSEYKISFPDEDVRDLVPLTPLSYAEVDNIFARSIAQITDDMFLERLRLEFAGLCNQIFSADALKPEGIEDLVRVTKKAAGYVNIGLERLSGGDHKISEEFIRNYPLTSIFRAGFGVTLELKWDTEKRIKNSWFIRNGLGVDFWGDEWGGILKGILMKRPHFYKYEYRPFEDLSEVKAAGSVLTKLFLMDQLIEEVSNLFNMDSKLFKDPLLTFHTFLFHSWAIMKLNLKPDFVPLSIDRAKEFFNLIRGEEKTPPFRLPGYGEVFTGDFIRLVKGLESPDKSQLYDALSELWEEFKGEYAFLEISALDPRFIKYIIVDPLLDGKTD